MTSAKIIHGLEEALEYAKRAEFERLHGFKPVYAVDAWPSLVPRDFPNGRTDPDRYSSKTVPFIGADE